MKRLTLLRGLNGQFILWREPDCHSSHLTQQNHISYWWREKMQVKANLCICTLHFPCLFYWITDTIKTNDTLPRKIFYFSNNGFFHFSITSVEFHLLLKLNKYLVYLIFSQIKDYGILVVIFRNQSPFLAIYTWYREQYHIKSFTLDLVLMLNCVLVFQDLEATPSFKAN
jgi:hypothetical protein